MKFNRTTKSALFTSVVSLFLCFTMLLGTTFAWFTDSATSTGNKIVAGTLNVDLLLYKNGNYTSIKEEAAPIFGDAGLAQNDLNTLWEPGKTQVAYLAIENDGSLDLAYKVNLAVTSYTKNLYEAMEYIIVPDAHAVDAPVAAGALDWDDGIAVVPGLNSTAAEKVTLEQDAIHYFALVIHMNEEAGNEYQGGEITFDINVLASQVNTEADSFGPDYDKDATYYITSDAVDVTTTPTEDVVLTSKSVNNAVKVVLDTAAVNNIPDEVTKVSLSHSEPVVDEANASISFEMVELVDQNNNPVDLTGNDAPIEVTLPAQSVFAPGSMVNIYHDGELIDKAIVNDDTTITYVAYHFCEVTIDAVPVAIVNNLGNKEITNIDDEKITLDCGYQFLPFHENADEAIASGYAGWHADFVVTVDKDVESVGAAGLAGYYSAWCELVDHKWVTIPMDGAELVAGEEFRLVSEMGLTVNYEEICTYSFAEGNVHDGFLCGAYADESMRGVTLNVELRLYEVGAQGDCDIGGGCKHPSVECETGNYIVIGQYSHTFE